MSVGQQTTLYQKHLDAGAKMVDFSGWDMPINYGSLLEERNQVRMAAGFFCFCLDGLQRTVPGPPITDRDIPFLVG